MKGSFELSIFSALFLVTGCSIVHEPIQKENKAPIIPITSEQKNKNVIKNLFDATQNTGVFIIQNKDGIQVYGNQLDRAQTPYVPASTFKMVNALIGLENEKVTLTEIFKWDGQKKSLAAWEKDMTLGEGMQVSNLPLFQQLARRIGVDLMQKEINRLDFGNNKVGNKVDNFWLVGPLKVTPVQEADFAYRLANKSLPFKQEVQTEVQKMVFLKEKNGKRIYGKTGLGQDGDSKVGWLTGWVEQPNGEKTAFSLNMKMQPNTPYSLRNEIVYQSLEQLGVI